MKKSKSKLFLFCTLVSVTLITRSYAAINVSISGGSGSPLTIEIFDDIVFTNVPSGLDSYGFALIGAAPTNLLTSNPLHTGSLVWQGSTGTDSGTGGMGTVSGNTPGFVVAQDVYARWASNGETQISTSTMTLVAGSRTTLDPVLTNVNNGIGTYEIRFIDNILRLRGDPGVVAAVPEPSYIGIIFGIVSFGFIGYIRMRNANEKQ